MWMFREIEKLQGEKIGVSEVLSGSRFGMDNYYYLLSSVLVVVATMYLLRM